MPDIPHSQSIVARCEKGLNWTNIEEFIVIEELIDMHGTRVKRFFISVPAAITAAVIGASVVGTASVVAATQIAKAETKCIVKTESDHRILDKENSLINALHLNNISVAIAKTQDRQKFMAMQCDHHRQQQLSQLLQ